MKAWYDLAARFALTGSSSAAVPNPLWGFGAPASVDADGGPPAWAFGIAEGDGDDAVAADGEGECGAAPADGADEAAFSWFGDLEAPTSPWQPARTAKMRASAPARRVEDPSIAWCTVSAAKYPPSSTWPSRSIERALEDVASGLKLWRAPSIGLT
jgi:hypothetical protein